MEEQTYIICKTCEESFALTFSHPYDEYCSWSCAQYDERYVEPTEDDLVSEDHQHWYQYGKCVLYVPEDKDYKKALRAYMKRTKFYPNIFWISDHGNAHLIKIEEE